MLRINNKTVGVLRVYKDTPGILTNTPYENKEAMLADARAFVSKYGADHDEYSLIIATDTCDAEFMKQLEAAAPGITIENMYEQAEKERRMLRHAFSLCFSGRYA